jgi:hypothetical protein
MSDAGNTDYVPDHLYERLFQPWTLPEAEWPLCKEDWARVDAITRLPWKGQIVDVGAGDGTLGAMVCSRNPLVSDWIPSERDPESLNAIFRCWAGWPLHCSCTGGAPRWTTKRFLDGALCCEVLEHLNDKDGREILSDLKRVMKPGAMLCVTVPWESGSRAVYPGHIRQFSWALLGKELREAGFTLDEKLSIDIKGIWLMAVCHA